MSVYYNENDPYAAQWLRNLIVAGHIAPGFVDERSITDVRPEDLWGFVQCHFFAGIGGWSYAARLAGWPDDRPLWTGSCPCQPFSIAGQHKGIEDERHLWPHFFDLIRAIRPPVVMGEQVAGKAGYGWFDGVQTDLESEDYAARAVDVPACAVDAPHIRQRLYWVAHPSDTGSQGWVSRRSYQKRQDQQRHAGRYGSTHSAWAEHAWLRGADGKSRRAQPSIQLLAHGVPARVGKLRAFGNAIVAPLAAEIITAYMESQCL